MDADDLKGESMFRWFRRRIRKHRITVFVEDAQHATARRAHFKIREKRR
jgi:hypothetical protein